MNLFSCGTPPYKGIILSGITDACDKCVREIAECIQKFFPDTTVESLETSVQKYKDIDAWKENPVLKQEAFDKLQLIMTEAGELTQKAPYDKIVNNSFAEKVCE